MKMMLEEPRAKVRIASRRLRKPAAKQLQIKKILVPIDFSRAAIGALRYATLLARTFGAEIHLLHVHADDECASVPAAGLLLDCRAAMKLAQARMRRLPDVAFRLENCHVRCGKPFREICKMAEAISADLIVLSTRGNSGLKRIVLGSTAERVVRFAHCPILIPRGRKFEAREEFSLQQILVPLDFSECSLRALDYAASLARRSRAKLCLFYAVCPYDSLMTADGAGANVLPTIETLNRFAAEQMARLRKRSTLRDLAVETRIGVGYPVDQIVAQTESGEFDLVMAATHGRTGFSHVLIGSVAEHIIRYAECPVMIIPTRGAQT